MDDGPIPGNALSSSRGDTNAHVLDVMRRAEQELRQLLAERTEVTKRIGTVKQTILGLAKLFGDGILNAALLDLVDHKSRSRQPGITWACRRVLIEARQPMSARAVCDEIQRSAPTLLASHKDPMATVNTILSRLVEYGEAIVMSGDHGQRAWIWAAENVGSSSVASNSNGSGSVA